MIKPLCTIAPSAWCPCCDSRLSINFNCANWACELFMKFNPAEYRRINGKR